jgi:hypothetical protein
MATRILTALLFTCLTGLTAIQADAQVTVDGHWRGNGSYVQPHVRTMPDSNPYNNYRIR